MQIGGMGAMPNPAMMHHRMMSRFDTDKSGGINLQEFTSMREAISARHSNAPIASGSAEEVFARIDADGSGELSSREMQAFRKANITSSGGMLGSDMMRSLLQCQNVDEGGGCHSRNAGGGASGPLSRMQERMMWRFDNDENGEFNLEEFSAMREAVSARHADAPIASGTAEEVFDNIDANGSGELSSSEMIEFHKANMPPAGSIINSLLQSQNADSGRGIGRLLQILFGDRPNK